MSIFIEKLQSQREQDRLEFLRAAQQVDEMESRMLAFKQQHDSKESENEQLKKEQYQTNQRLEDLEFQLEEYKLTDANKEHTAAPSIPDGHRLLSPKDIEIYEQVKAKVLDLESINQKLILEKQTLQDEHRQESKRQNELNENDLKSRLNELELKYNNDLKNIQTNNIDKIKSEYETKLNDKDKQLNQLIEPTKQEKQQEIDQLKSQITMSLNNSFTVSFSTDDISSEDTSEEITSPSGGSAIVSKSVTTPALKNTKTSPPPSTTDDDDDSVNIDDEMDGNDQTLSPEELFVSPDHPPPENIIMSPPPPEDIIMPPPPHEDIILSPYQTSISDQLRDINDAIESIIKRIIQDEFEKELEKELEKAGENDPFL